MLNHFFNYKEQLENLLPKISNKSLLNSFNEIYKNIDTAINILNGNTNTNSKTYVTLENLSKEFNTLLSICTIDKINTIPYSDISFSIKIILEFEKELEKEWNNICNFEMADTNAEMKLLENILKEDGFFEESN